MLNIEARRKLKELLPLGMVATKRWLVGQGFAVHFLDNAVRSGTLVPLAPGVYALHEARVTWQGVVASLQRMSQHPVHIGGLTALELAGLAHYLPLSSNRRVHLYSRVKQPGWLGRVGLEVQFDWHSTRRLWPEAVMDDARFTKSEHWRDGLSPLWVSCPERAFLEVLVDVPSAVGFEHASELMQGLTNLSPRKLDALLRACDNVKVKRLFLWFAERAEHAWFRRLDPKSYDLGSGKRVVASQGRLDKTWQITVPKDM